MENKLEKEEEEKEEFSQDSDKFQNYFEILIIMMNDFSYFLLSNGEPKTALKILHKCLTYILEFRLHRKHNYFISLIYNHIACCHRKLGQIQIAL